MDGISRGRQLKGPEDLTTGTQDGHTPEPRVEDEKRIFGSHVNPGESHEFTGSPAFTTDAGGSYLLGANDWRSAAPELLPIGRDMLVLVPRIATDDLARDPGFARDLAAAERSFGNEFAHVRALGGLYTLSYHSRVLGRPEHLPVLARLGRTIASNSGVWIPPASAVGGWWTARAQLDMVVRAPPHQPPGADR